MSLPSSPEFSPHRSPYPDFSPSRSLSLESVSSLQPSSTDGDNNAMDALYILPSVSSTALATSQGQAQVPFSELMEEMFNAWHQKRFEAAATDPMRPTRVNESPVPSSGSAHPVPENPSPIILPYDKHEQFYLTHKNIYFVVRFQS